MQHMSAQARGNLGSAPCRSGACRHGFHHEPIYRISGVRQSAGARLGKTLHSLGLSHLGHRRFELGLPHDGPPAASSGRKLKLVEVFAVTIHASIKNSPESSGYIAYRARPFDDRIYCRSRPRDCSRQNFVSQQKHASTSGSKPHAKSTQDDHAQRFGRANCCRCSVGIRCWSPP